MAGCMSTLDRLHIQVYSAVLFTYCSISAVCKRTTAAVAEASHVVLVPAEVECFRLGFEAAMIMIDNLHTIYAEIHKLLV